MTAWTRAAVEALGPTTNVPTAAAIVDVNSETVYAAIRNGTWTTTRVLRIGRVIKIPTLDLIRLLYAPEAGVSAPVPGVPAPCQHLEYVLVSDRKPQSQCGCSPSDSGPIPLLRRVT